MEPVDERGSGNWDSHSTVRRVAPSPDQDRQTFARDRGIRVGLEAPERRQIPGGNKRCSSKIQLPEKSGSL